LERGLLEPDLLERSPERGPEHGPERVLQRSPERVFERGCSRACRGGSRDDEEPRMSHRTELPAAAKSSQSYIESVIASDGMKRVNYSQSDR
jgi:hypothetical protein